MWIKKLRLHNWMSFRGEMVLDLEPKIYALSARHVKDPGRSNFLGKSALLEAIFFALTGKLNPDRHLGADGWVSDGEKEGAVSIVFNDGKEIRRERKKTTQIYFDKAKGDEAQALIDGFVGLTPEDFLATCYFQQRQMARLVLADPGERMKYVRAWFQLEPLERGEEMLRDEAARLAAEIEQCNASIRSTTEVEAREGTLEGLKEVLLQLERDLEIVIDREARLTTLVRENDDRMRAKGRVKEHEEIKREIAELETQMEQMASHTAAMMLTEAREVATKAHTKFSDVHRQLEQKKKLSLKQFDGHCPVGEMKCPVTKELNSQTAHNAKLVTEVEKELAVAREDLDDAKSSERSADLKMQSVERIRTRIEELQNREVKLSILISEVDPIPPADPEDLQARLSRASQQVGDKRSAFRLRQEGLGLVENARAQREKYTAKKEGYEKQLQTHREAIVIFGKQGAQRRVAEPALREIQNGGNAMLQECSIPLDFEISWSREGAGPAKTCDACGSPFPASRAVKECSRCKTPRGQLLVNKLDLILSEQSGAAEDLIGASIQFAASAWLRRRRGSFWSTALLDEPAGQLDETHRAAFASHLAALLGTRYGFEQAIVTAHHRSFLDVLPGKIEILHDGKRATARVVI
jgi:DNA repair exonuclease SbcCD ATPase subunit